MDKAARATDEILGTSFGVGNTYEGAKPIVINICTSKLLRGGLCKSLCRSRSNHAFGDRYSCWAARISFLSGVYLRRVGLYCYRCGVVGHKALECKQLAEERHDGGTEEKEESSPFRTSCNIQEWDSHEHRDAGMEISGNRVGK